MCFFSPTNYHSVVIYFHRRCSSSDLRSNRMGNTNTGCNLLCNYCDFQFHLSDFPSTTTARPRRKASRDFFRLRSRHAINKRKKKSKIKANERITTRVYYYIYTRPMGFHNITCIFFFRVYSYSYTVAARSGRIYTCFFFYYYFFRGRKLQL